MARKSTLGESTILRRSFGGCELASISRVAFSFLNSMYYMLFRMGLDRKTNFLDGGSKVRSGVRRGFLSLRDVLQMLT